MHPIHIKVFVPNATWTVGHWMHWHLCQEEAAIFTSSLMRRLKLV